MDVIWEVVGLFNSHDSRRPNWSGYIQDISQGYHHSQSHIAMLPTINLNPSTETCIYSTLLFIIDVSKKLIITTPCVTLDQALWIKSIEIITLKSLGGFHMLMSFVGSVGESMEGSGLENALGTLYGPNTQITQGK